MTEYDLYYGMIGGGEGSFIGDVHRKAIRFNNNNVRIKAGCFSRNYVNCLNTGQQLGICKDRLYNNYIKMAEMEAREKEKIDFVVIVTPNHTHYPIAKAFLEKGFHVVCEKPLTVNLQEAEELNELAKKNQLLSCVTYTYSGYPMVKQAREMIHHGELGQIRMVLAEYAQEWLATPIEKKGNKQATWRTNPGLAGKSNCVGDIGTHMEHTVSYITGLEIESLCAQIDTFVRGRKLDDNAEFMVKYKNEARGLYWCSQVAIGNNNGLKIRVYGSKGSIEWKQESPDYLKYCPLNKPVQYLSKGRDPLYPEGEKFVRLPAGHPEGFYEAFANIYSSFLESLISLKKGNDIGDEFDFPTVKNGLQGIKFVNLAINSSDSGSKWFKWEEN